jgi:APA family basic amino acid/polyamine antiporter
MATTSDEVKTGLVKGLGLMDSTTLVVGSMIGSGIFIVSADIARQVNSPGLLLMTWVATAALTLIAALSYGELAAAMPQAGGHYVFLRESFGPLSGFLYGWTLFLVIQTGTIAAVAVAFAKFAAVFVPWISANNHLIGTGKLGLSTLQLVAIVIVGLLAAVNMRGVRTGAIVQNVFAFAKTAALLGLIAIGFLLGRNPAALTRNFGPNWGNFWSGAGWSLHAVRLVGVAMVGSLFSADAWNNVTFTAGEIRNPRRNLPLALTLGVGIVMTLYLLANCVYLTVLPLEGIQHAADDRVATAAMKQILGPVGVQVMAASIMISCFGCVNGLTLAGARVYYAMSLDGLFFRRAATLGARHHAPVFALAIQGAWAMVLTLSGSYSDLLDYVIFAVLVFYILSIAGIFVLRRTRPGMERPYKAFGYPILPAIYIVAASAIEILLLAYKPNYTWPGLIIVLLGVPVYFIWKPKSYLPKGLP